MTNGSQVKTVYALCCVKVLADASRCGESTRSTQGSRRFFEQERTAWMESERTRALEVLAAFAAPWRPRFGRTRRVGAIAVVCAATEIAGLIAASWRWTRYLLGP